MDSWADSMFCLFVNSTAAWTFVYIFVLDVLFIAPGCVHLRMELLILRLTVQELPDFPPLLHHLILTHLFYFLDSTYK